MKISKMFLLLSVLLVLQFDEYTTCGEIENYKTLPQESEVQNSLSFNIIVDSQEFSATFYDNESAHAFAEMLPLTLNMDELNGNEKYYFFDTSLPGNSQQVGQIQAGDLMLYGNDCLVLFYESFASGYSYTRLGTADNPSGLAEALGNGSVTITFLIE